MYLSELICRYCAKTQAQNHGIGMFFILTVTSIHTSWLPREPNCQMSCMIYCISRMPKLLHGSLYYSTQILELFLHGSSYYSTYWSYFHYFLSLTFWARYTTWYADACFYVLNTGVKDQPSQVGDKKTKSLDCSKAPDDAVVVTYYSTGSAASSRETVQLLHHNA